jgi:hypothetical protein
MLQPQPENKMLLAAMLLVENPLFDRHTPVYHRVEFIRAIYFWEAQAAQVSILIGQLLKRRPQKCCKDN